MWGERDRWVVGLADQALGAYACPSLCPPIRDIVPRGEGWLHFGFLWHGSCPTLRPTSPLHPQLPESGDLAPSPPRCKYQTLRPAARLEEQAGQCLVSSQKHQEQPRDPLSGQVVSGVSSQQIFQNKTGSDMSGWGWAGLATFLQARRASTLLVRPGPSTLEGWGRRKVPFSLPSPLALPQGGLHRDPHTQSRPPQHPAPPFHPISPQLWMGGRRSVTHMP